MTLSGNKAAKKKKVVYDADTLALIGPQIPREKAAGKEEEEARKDQVIRELWREFPRSLSEITLGIGVFGRPLRLMEILEVRIESTTRKPHKLKLHGTIEVDSAYGISDVFRRTTKNPEVIHAEDTLTLMGPTMASVAYDFADVIVDLKDGRREVCRGCVCFNTYHTWPTMFNKPLVGKVAGKNAIGFVTYAIMPRAMLIQVEIRLPKMQLFDFKFSAEATTVKVYGRIDASMMADATSSLLTTTLFRRKHTDGVVVGADSDLLPLSKSLMAFPIGGTVDIDLHLKEHLLFKSSNCTIVGDAVRCTPTQFGNHKCTVDSKYGSIEIKVTAYPPEMHPKTFLAFREHILEMMV